MTARRVLVAGCVLFAVSLAVLIGAGLAVPGGLRSMLDLRIYQWGGQIASHSGDLYGLSYRHTRLQFTYPPVAAVVFAAVSYLPLTFLKVAVAAGSVAALVVVSWLAWGALGYRRSRERLGGALVVAAVAVWSEPVWQTLTFGQVNIVLMLIILADLCLPDSARWKGAGVGLAAGFKLTPLIFIAYLLVTGRFRAAGVALATFVATIVIPAVLLPSQSLRYWAGGLFMDPRRVGNLAYVGNQSLNGLLLRLIGDASVARAAWVVAAVVVGSGGLLLAMVAARRGHELAGIVICALTGLEISPVSWSHNCVWIAPALVLALHGTLRVRAAASRWRRRAAWTGVLALLGVFFSQLIWVVPRSAVQGRGLPGLWLLPGDLYPLAGLAALGVAAIMVIRERPDERAALVVSDVPAGVYRNVVAGDVPGGG